MRRTALRIGAELIPLLLVFTCLAAAFGLIVQAHRRALAPKTANTPVPIIATAPKPPAVVVLPPPPTPQPEPEPEPVDPTQKALAEIQTHLDEQRDEARKADAEAERLEASRQALADRTEGWKRRQMLAREQLDRVDKAVSTLEQQADVLARMRDVLAAKRDKEKVELVVAKSRSGVAILPYRGANGTWRLPIVIECRNGTATLQPNGPSFSLVQLSGIFSTRTSPIARAVALRLMELQNIESPDGHPVVPYLLFVVRPDGIRPYYEARSRLEPLGITFGYELVDADVDIDFPDLADVSEWSEIPGKKKPAPVDGEYVWPADRPGVAGKGPDAEFLWPTNTQTAAAGTGGDGTGTHNAGRAPFDPLAKPGIEPYSGPKHRLDSLLGSGGHPAMPGFEHGGLTPGDESVGGQSPLKQGRVELTPEDLVAAIEENLGSEPGSPSGREITDPDPLAEPAPFPPGLGQFAQDGGGRTAPARTEPAGAVGQRRPSGGFPPNRTGQPHEAQDHQVADPFSGGPPVGTEGNRGTGTIGSYGEAFTPSGGEAGVAGTTGVGSTHADASAGQASQAGTATPAGSGGGPGQGKTGDATPGIVGLSLDGAEGKSAGKGGGSGGGDGKGEGSAESSEAYRKRRNLEMVIACGPNGLVVHPGGYRLSLSSLDADHGRLDKVLHGIVRNHETKDPKSEWMPRLKYLVEPGGQVAYTKARQQNINGASTWPAHLKVTEGSPLRIAVEEKITR